MVRNPRGGANFQRTPHVNASPPESAGSQYWRSKWQTTLKTQGESHEESSPSLSAIQKLGADLLAD
jgi:hypothetical protein